MCKKRELKVHDHLVEELTVFGAKLVYVDNQLSDYDFRHTIDRVKKRLPWRLHHHRGAA